MLLNNISAELHNPDGNPSADLMCCIDIKAVHSAGDLAILGLLLLPLAKGQLPPHPPPTHKTREEVIVVMRSSPGKVGHGAATVPKRFGPQLILRKFSYASCFFRQACLKSLSLIIFHVLCLFKRIASRDGKIYRRHE
jgi:hypothetical protein